MCRDSHRPVPIHGHGVCIQCTNRPCTVCDDAESRGLGDQGCAQDAARGKYLSKYNDVLPTYLLARGEADAVHVHASSSLHTLTQSMHMHPPPCIRCSPHEWAVHAHAQCMHMHRACVAQACSARTCLLHAHGMPSVLHMACLVHAHVMPSVLHMSCPVHAHVMPSARTCHA